MAAARPPPPAGNNATRRQAEKQRKIDDINRITSEREQQLLRKRTEYTRERQLREQQIQQIQQQIFELHRQLQTPNLSPQEKHQMLQEINELVAERNKLYSNDQHLFKVISAQIKTLINVLKNAAANRGNLNDVVDTTIKRLEIMGDSVDEFAEIQVINEEMRDRRKQVIAGIGKQDIRDFINGDKTTSEEGVLSQGNKTITLETLDFNSQNDAARLETEYQDTPTTPEAIQNRLINCQYLEILYLTKHDELMNIFRFTLNLYDKYTYAIKILLFVLKNLLEQRPCPPREYPPEQPHPPIDPRQIKLPKALISNIKQLLKDQKHVQDVIGRLKPVVENAVPDLVNRNIASYVSSSNLVGSTMDTENP